MATASNVLPAINLLYRRPIVEQATGDSRSTIYRKIKQGLFTKPVQIGGERVTWPANEVQASKRVLLASLMLILSCLLLSLKHQEWDLNRG
jgi:prophage regulatory protein